MKEHWVFLMNDPLTTPELWASADIKGSVILKDIQKQNDDYKQRKMDTLIYITQKKADYWLLLFLFMLGSCFTESRNMRPSGANSGLRETARTNNRGPFSSWTDCKHLLSQYEFSTTCHTL